MSDADRQNLLVAGAIAAVAIGVGILYQQDKLPANIRSSIDSVGEAIGVKEKSAVNKASDALNKAAKDAESAGNKAAKDAEKAVNKAADDLKKA